MEKKTIKAQIEELKTKLSNLNPDKNIHNFISGKEKYKKKIESFKKLTFSISSQLTFNKNQKRNKSNQNDAKEQEEKLTNFQWAGEGSFSNRIVSCTNKGNVFVFNSDKGNIIFHHQLVNGILNACAIEPIENQMFAVGGFDGVIILKNILISKERSDDENGKKFTGHFGSVSTIRFLNTNYLLSASFDSVILLWDSQGKIISSYMEHTGEVSSLDVSERNGNIFVTGSGDTTVKLWDIRQKKACVATFQGCDSSINCVKFVPGRVSTVAAGSEDSTIRLYDYRAVKELGLFRKDNDDYNAVNSIGFSRSGFLLFASFAESNTISFWHLFREDQTPIMSYDYPFGVNDGGISKISIDSSGKYISFIHKDKIVILK